MGKVLSAQLRPWVPGGTHFHSPNFVLDPSGNENAGNYRDSDTIGLYNSSEEIVQHFRSLMANLAMLPIENSEVLQLTRYTPGQKYGLHFDSSLNVGRVVTVLVFLDEVIEGGELVFPWAKLRAGVELDGVSGPGRNISDLVGVHVEPDIDAMCALDSGSLLIAPRVGRVALFYSHRPDLRRESYAAMHGGCRVTQGTKFIAQLWFDWSIFGNSNSNHIATIFQHVGMSQWQVNPTESVL